MNAKKQTLGALLSLLYGMGTYQPPPGEDHAEHEPPSNRTPSNFDISVGSCNDPACQVDHKVHAEQGALVLARLFDGVLATPYLTYAKKDKMILAFIKSVLGVSGLLITAEAHGVLERRDAEGYLHSGPRTPDELYTLIGRPAIKDALTRLTEWYKHSHSFLANQITSQELTEGWE